MIIREDTVWKRGSVVRLKSDVEIASDASLRIEPGVKVVGGTITAYGDLLVEGTESERVTFKNTIIEAGSVNYAKTSHIDASYFNMDGGRFLPANGSADYANFDIDHAYFHEVEGFYIWYPYGDNSIRNSIFEDSYGLSIGVDEATVDIRGNLFLPSDYTYSGNASIVVWANYGELDDVTVANNNFELGRGDYALEVPSGYGSIGMKATGNYFGTSNPREIQKLILDNMDALDRFSKIDVSDSADQHLAEVPALGDFDFDLQQGGGRADKIRGDGGNNWLFGKGGDDRLIGKGGHDLLEGGNGADRLAGQMGNDSAYGGRGGDLLLGQAGSDLLEGGGGRDVLKGGLGRDTISGGTGADMIAGGKGGDVLSGGRGSDHFIYKSVAELDGDLITDFNGDRGDRVDLQQLMQRESVEDINIVVADTFSGAAGEVIVLTEGRVHTLIGDMNGDAVADFSFQMVARHTPDLEDFLL